MKIDEIIEIRRKHRANIPGKHHEAYRVNWDKAIEGKSLRACVKSKCLDCMNWLASEVKACSCAACPLFEVRPYVKHPKRRQSRKTPPDVTPNKPTAHVE